MNGVLRLALAASVVDCLLVGCSVEPIPLVRDDDAGSVTPPPIDRDGSSGDADVSVLFDAADAHVPDLSPGRDADMGVEDAAVSEAVPDWSRCSELFESEPPPDDWIEEFHFDTLEMVRIFQPEVMKIGCFAVWQNAAIETSPDVLKLEHPKQAGGGIARRMLACNACDRPASVRFIDSWPEESGPPTKYYPELDVSRPGKPEVVAFADYHSPYAAGLHLELADDLGRALPMHCIEDARNSAYGVVFSDGTSVPPTFIDFELGPSEILLLHGLWRVPFGLLLRYDSEPIPDDVEARHHIEPGHLSELRFLDAVSFEALDGELEDPYPHIGARCADQGLFWGEAVQPRPPGPHYRASVPIDELPIGFFDRTVVP
ncbi:MAG TPA: hypothetical protein RMG48_05050 [Myxococcales bacterium LLY-WYZ-16_1]|nr:hypothetical protein [Myxococcales bacterium LLY-WYZ-16_1]